MGSSSRGAAECSLFCIVSCRHIVLGIANSLVCIDCRRWVSLPASDSHGHGHLTFRLMQLWHHLGESHVPS